MKDTELDKNELYRLASLIGCEPEDEERHRKQLLEYILSHYIAKSEVEKMIGKDEPEAVYTTDQSYSDVHNAIGIYKNVIRNQLRAEQRLKLRGGK